MKIKKGRFFAAFCLAAVLLLSLAACGSKPKTMLSLEKDGRGYAMSVNEYQLFLSRLKGSLAMSGFSQNGLTPAQSAFWDIVDVFPEEGEDPVTLSVYYKNRIKEMCAEYLVADYLFDEYGLSLTDEEVERVEDDLYELVRTDGNGSDNQLNAVLADYGVNKEILREVYLREARIAKLKSYLYTVVGDNMKAAYLEEHYVHFHQIYLANYRYVYEKDRFGDEIYYDTDNSMPLYRVTAYKGETVSGLVTYYTDETFTHYAYDTVKGQRAYQMEDDGMTYKVEEFTPAEVTALQEEAEGLFEQVKNLSAAEFSAVEGEKSQMSAKESGYTDGYYLPRGVSYETSDPSYAYLDEISAWLETAEIGDAKLFTSAYGCHIVKKYAMTESAWDKAENATWFSTWKTDVAESYFSTLCRDIVGEVKCDEDVFTEVPNMSAVKINYYY